MAGAGRPAGTRARGGERRRARGPAEFSRPARVATAPRTAKTSSRPEPTPPPGGGPGRRGETGGHAQPVAGVYADWDGAVLLARGHREGVACHTGHRTCFFTALHGGGDGPPAPAGMLERLERTIATRKSSPAPGSYVAGLLAKGEPAICRKIGEEAAEVMTAALGGEGNQRLVEGTADLWFHTLVVLGARGIPLQHVLQETARRPLARPTSPGKAGRRVAGPRCGTARAAPAHSP